MPASTSVASWRVNVANRAGFTLPPKKGIENVTFKDWKREERAAAGTLVGDRPVLAILMGNNPISLMRRKASL
jgi:hypothetical protein